MEPIRSLLQATQLLVLQARGLVLDQYFGDEIGKAFHQPAADKEYYYGTDDFQAERKQP